MFSEQYLVAAEIKCDDVDRQVYPYNLPVVQNNQRLDFDQSVTFIIGDNGSGKSTLIEALAVAYGFNPEGGTNNYRFATYETHSELYEHIRLVKGVQRPEEGYFFRAESFYGAKTYLESIGQTYGERPMHQYSHGESLLNLFMSRLKGNGLYILDEPEAALSPQSQLALIVRMDQLIRLNSQFIIATHSPILLAFPEAAIYVISPTGALQPITYEETETYKLYRSFLTSYESFIRHLVE